MKTEQKTYYTRVPNSTFIVSLTDAEGKVIPSAIEVLHFHGDRLVTDHPDAIAQLDAVANAQGSTIYTDSTKKGVMADEKLPFSDVKERAGQVVEQIAKAGQRA